MLIAGGSGLIGKAIADLAKQDRWEVSILSRSSGKGHIVWDPAKQSIRPVENASFDAVINLAGASLAAGRWTEKRKKLIQESRLDSCATLEKYLSSGAIQTKVYIGASAIGIYGSHNDQTVNEDTPIREEDEFLNQTCRLWENGHRSIEALGIRTVIFRIGLVMSRNGGALKEILQTAPFGLLSYFGNGHQRWSWIHIADMARSVMHAISCEDMHGVVLATAPNPVSNKALTMALNNTYAIPRLVLPVPRFVLSIMLGEMHTSLFQDCAGRPERLLQTNFEFRYANIDDAMKALMKVEE